MFTLDQIQTAFKKVKSGADFPHLVQELKQMGVVSYDNYVEHGQTHYFGHNDFVIRAAGKYPPKTVNAESSKDKLKHALSIHQNGKTDYLTFCEQAADAGIHKWCTDLNEMTVSYSDNRGNLLLVETIPQLPTTKL